MRPGRSDPGHCRAAEKPGFEVAIEAGAGLRASFDDAAFEGCRCQRGTERLASRPLSSLVNAPTEAEIAQIKDGATLVSFIWPAQNPELVKKLSERNINVMAMDMVPRISRAQSLDALFHGQHRWLSRCRGSRTPVRSLLHRPDHRRR